ncbi:MAG TPA: PAS domain S-box protein [Candidatus Brocadiaceae bacterium]|nr:PAS domain S-box protein [Candidatus Brocadiaceae bacterium]
MENEEKYRLLVESIPDVVWTLDQKGNTVFISPMVEEVCGYTPEEIYTAGNRFWHERIHSEDIEKVKSACESLFKSNRSLDIEYRIQKKDGNWIWIRDRAKTTHKKGGVTYANGIFSDITLYKRTTEEMYLLQTMALAISTSRNLHDALVVTLEKICAFTGWAYGEAWMLNKDGTLLERDHTYYSAIEVFDKFSEYTEGLTFAKGSGLPGRAWSEKQPVWVQDVTLDPNYLRASIAKEVGIKTGVAFPVIANDEVVYIMIFYHVKAKEKDDGLVKLISTILAQLGMLIERKKAEDALYESEQKLKAILDNAPLVIYAKDTQGRYLFVNKQHENIFTINRGELEGKTDYACLPKEAANIYVAHDRKVIETQKPMQFEETAMQAGELRTFVSTKFPLFDSTGSVYAVCGIATDITERRQMQAEMEQLEKQLYHAQNLAALGKLAGGVAHNFNNLLMVVMGYASLLNADIKEDGPLREYVQNILSSSQIAANLTQDLLAFSREKTFNKQPINLSKILEEFGGILSNLIGEDIKLKMMLTDKDCIVKANDNQMKHVLMNLATNARDAMSNGGELYICLDIIEIDKTFIQAHGYGEAGKYALISIADTGVGMDEDTRLRIFEPFFTTKEVGRGTGLGLSIVYGIIKDYDGYIDVSSEPGDGATFRIYLPLVVSEYEQTKQETPATSQKDYRGTILLAEDKSAVRKVMKTIFERADYKVIEAGDGEEALDKFAQNKDIINLLVFDLIMPKRNGKEVYDIIRKMRPDIKVLFVSGYGEEVISKTGISKEGLNFIRKPISATGLIEKVRCIMDR